jgi:hypothetical protein
MGDRERMLRRPVQPRNSAEVTFVPPSYAAIPEAGTWNRNSVVYAEREFCSIDVGYAKEADCSA